MRERGFIVLRLQRRLMRRPTRTVDQGNMMSFAGPMVYNEFGKADPSIFTMDSFYPRHDQQRQHR